MTERIRIMVSYWKKYHWAKSNLLNNDKDFFKPIRMSPVKVATTSFNGQDIIYYKFTKVKPWVGSMIDISKYKEIVKKRKFL